MITILKTLRTLTGYILCGLLFVGPFVILSAFALFGSRWAFNSLYSIDIAICSICHGTKLESISARSYRLRNDKRYYYQMTIIDLLARPFDGHEHCRRAYKWENKVISNF
ncbi:hypothetical protein PS1M3_18890 [Pseudoalteromonas sp. PS1M3]|jgi:hypothetical protein|uniref:hypothetical protein n=1 Tax=Pseudoalteromonas sp. PS1M3 TaxID=87791 RepID=UPI00195163E1|nr:hypothetical protein [Pseudoalteromonas sp. PS1M3]BBW91802.1 hypothetical protein PS1M3_18890 [Pseudoalteromonas sp. PS1M3]